MYRKTAIALALVALTAAGAAAGPAPDDLIARLSLIEGHVSFQHVGEVDWNAASINLALQPGDRIYTGQDGRAEIQFDDGSVLRLAEQADVEILALKEDLIQLRLLVGLVSLTVRSDLPFEVGTPAAVFTTRQEGAYRFDVLENGDSDGIVRKGILAAANDKFQREAVSGEVIHVPAGEQGAGELSRYDQRDAWDEWCDRRDADLTAYESRKYLPEHVRVGVSDLDRYGRWVEVETYGPAWVPYYVDPYWSPYWDGRWVYRPFWGWTWVSYEPWGWLPFHYGRWHFAARFGWCWLPGPAFGFHFWSPGLVRFHRGPGWVTWCPLGPGDYYDINNYFFRSQHSHYLTNLRMLERHGSGQLANWNAPRSVRGLPLDDFVNGSPRGRGRSPEDDPGLFRGPRSEIAGALDVRPTARSFAPAPERAAVRPAGTAERPTFVRTPPSGEAARGGRFIPLSETGLPARSMERVPATRTGDEATPARGYAGTARQGAAATPPASGEGRRIESRPAAPQRQAVPAAEPERGNGVRIYQVPAARRGENAQPARGGQDGYGQRPSIDRRSAPATGAPAQAPVRRTDQANPQGARPAPAAAPARRPDSTTGGSSRPPQQDAESIGGRRSLGAASAGEYRTGSAGAAPWSYRARTIEPSGMGGFERPAAPRAMPQGNAVPAPAYSYSMSAPRPSMPAARIPSYRTQSAGPYSMGGFPRPAAPRAMSQGGAGRAPAYSMSAPRPSMPAARSAGGGRPAAGGAPGRPRR
jgi:hypothetical protein